MPEATLSQPVLLRHNEGAALWFVGNLVTLRATQDQAHGHLTVAEFVNPAGFPPPLHRHLVEDEMIFLLAGNARFHCGEVVLDAGPGDFVLLPATVPHTFVVGPGAPLRALQITTPGGFEHFAREAARPATSRRLPDPAAADPATLGHTAARHHIEILGPPPAT